MIFNGIYKVPGAPPFARFLKLQGIQSGSLYSIVGGSMEEFTRVVGILGTNQIVFPGPKS